MSALAAATAFPIVIGSFDSETIVTINFTDTPTYTLLAQKISAELFVPVYSLKLHYRAESGEHVPFKTDEEFLDALFANYKGFPILVDFKSDPTKADSGSEFKADKSRSVAGGASRGFEVSGGDFDFSAFGEASYGSSSVSAASLSDLDPQALIPVFLGYVKALNYKERTLLSDSLKLNLKQLREGDGSKTTLNTFLAVAPKVELLSEVSTVAALIPDEKWRSLDSDIAGMTPEDWKNVESKLTQVIRFLPMAGLLAGKFGLPAAAPAPAAAVKASPEPGTKSSIAKKLNPLSYFKGRKASSAAKPTSEEPEIPSEFDAVESASSAPAPAPAPAASARASASGPVASSAARAPAAGPAAVAGGSATAAELENLATLESMGFADRELNLQLLRELGNDISRVITVLS